MKLHFWQFWTFSKFKNWFLAIFGIARKWILAQKIFSWNWFIWFREFFVLDFSKFFGLLWFMPIQFHEKGTMKTNKIISNTIIYYKNVCYRSSNVASASSLDSLNTEIKSSPKLTRTESIGERTMQKISKVIRGSSRSESRSKKTRETSLSPSGNSKESSKGKKDLSSKEKRDLFKSGGQ